MLRTSWSALAAKCCAFLIAVYMAGISPDVGAQAVAPVAGSQDERVTAWWETARRDHDNRKSRLLQLSQNQFVGSPEFYTDLVSRADLPQFPVDVPILRVVFPAKALFDFDKDQIRTDMAKVLDTVGQALRSEPHSLSVFVAGHTDGIGDESYNLMLSIRRAENVARELNQRGVGNAGIWRIGFGKAVPLRPNTTDENRAINRRVEFLMAARPEAIAVWLSKQADLICKSGSSEEMKLCREALNLSSKFEAVPISSAAKEAPAISPKGEIVDFSVVGPIVVDLKRREYEVIGRPQR
jgi:outer membrane protein OmpA-like peptidoglycan-associated protein